MWILIRCSYQKLADLVLQCFKTKGINQSSEGQGLTLKDGLNFTCCGEKNSLCLKLKRYEVTCDFQQCGILTLIDSDEPVQPSLRLETPNAVWSIA